MCDGEQVNKGGADKVMVEAAEGGEASEGPTNDQRLAALEAKVCKAYSCLCD